jgi:hypothetical protein
MSVVPEQTADIISSISALISALALTVSAVSAHFTRKNIELVSRQIASQASNSIIEAHKNLFMSIIESDELSGLVAAGDLTKFRQNMISSMLINHCSRIYGEYKRASLGADDFDSFLQDALDLFSMQIVRDRWPAVERFHDENFSQFINEYVFPRL